jgi:flagellar basal-body rod protein FlgF
MNVSLYQAAAAMNAQSRWQELITENLASASVPGFRKKEISFSAVEAGLDPTAIGPNNSRYVIPSARTATSFQPGELRATGNSMDFALEGPGFFEVELSNGSRAYTRDGEFHLDAQGQLVTKQGYPVMSDSGHLQFDPSLGGTITVSANGDVSQGSEVKGRIRLAEFNDPKALTSIGTGYFSADNPNVQMLASASTSIRQGYLEGSNTSPTAEMASLITSMRMFEASQRVLQMQDERMGKVVSEIANPS